MVTIRRNGENKVEYHKRLRKEASAYDKACSPVLVHQSTHNSINNLLQAGGGITYRRKKDNV